MSGWGLNPMSCSLAATWSSEMSCLCIMVAPTSTVALPRVRWANSSTAFWPIPGTGEKGSCDARPLNPAFIWAVAVTARAQQPQAPSEADKSYQSAELSERGGCHEITRRIRVELAPRDCTMRRRSPDRFRFFSPAGDGCALLLPVGATGTRAFAPS